MQLERETNHSSPPIITYEASVWQFHATAQSKLPKAIRRDIQEQLKHQAMLRLENLVGSNQIHKLLGAHLAR